MRGAGHPHPVRRLFVVLSLTSSSFATKANLLNILDQQSATLIIAAAGTLVLVAGGIDLSVGAIYSFAGVTSAHFALETNAAIAILLGIGAGLLIGLANGSSRRLRINALIDDSIPVKPSRPMTSSVSSVPLSRNWMCRLRGTSPGAGRTAWPEDTPRFLPRFFFDRPGDLDPLLLARSGSLR